MSRAPPQPQPQNNSSNNPSSFLPPRHHPFPHQSQELHHLPPHAFDPSIGGLFPPHPVPFHDSFFHPMPPSQSQPSIPQPPPPTGPPSFHPPPSSRKPSLLSGYHNPFSSPERNERLINSAMNQSLHQQQQQQQQQQQLTRFVPPPPSQQASQQLQSIRAANPAMTEAALAAMAALTSADQLGPGGRGNYDTTNAAAAAVIAATNTYMSMFAGGRPPVNVSPGNPRTDEKYLRGPGPGPGPASASKLRPISPETIVSKDMQMRGSLPHSSPKFSIEDQKELLMMRDRGKIRDIEEKYMSARGGSGSLPPPPSSASAPYPSHFTSSMMAAITNAMPPPTSSPSQAQFVQFIQQLQQQQQQQQQTGKMLSNDLLISMPPPPPPKKEILQQSNPLMPLPQMYPPKHTPSPSSSQPNSVSLPHPQPPPSQLPPTISTSSTSSSSSSYVPQVEAISPTPEDQKENSSVQLMKDKIISEIEKVEKDLASTQYQIEMLKKRTIELAEEQSKKPLDGNNDVEKLIQVSKTMTLAEKIYQENRKKAEESHRKNLQPIDENVYLENIPFYHEFSDTQMSQEIRTQFDVVMKKRLMKFFKRQITIKKQRERSLIDDYDTLHTKWQKKVDRFENSIKKRQKDGKSREFYEKVFPEIRKQREERERLIQKQKAAAAAVIAAASSSSSSSTTTTATATTSSDPSTQASAQTSQSANSQASEPTPNPENEPNPIEEERKRIHALSVVPPLCLDSRHRRYKFINNNGFIQDPVSFFKSIKNEIFWNEKEKEIFLDKLVTFGKNFEHISTYLEKKSVQDCIEYYYLTKKKVNYKMLIRKNQRRRKKDVKTTTANSTSGSNAASNTTGTNCTTTSNTSANGSVASSNNSSSSQLINSNSGGSGSNGAKS